MGAARALLLFGLGSALVGGVQQRVEAQFMAAPFPTTATPSLGVAADASTFTGADVLKPYLNVRTTPRGASTAGLLRLVDNLAPSNYGNTLGTSF